MYSLADKNTDFRGDEHPQPRVFTLFDVSIFFGFQIPPSPQPKTKFLPKCPRIIKCYACKWDKDDWKHRNEVMLGRESSFVCEWQLPKSLLSRKSCRSNVLASPLVCLVLQHLSTTHHLGFCLFGGWKKSQKIFPKLGGEKWWWNQSHG